MSGTQDVIWGNCFVFELQHADLILHNDMQYNTHDIILKHAYTFVPGLSLCYCKYSAYSLTERKEAEHTAFS